MCPSVSVRKSTKWRRKHPLGFPTGLRDHEAVGSNPATRTMSSVHNATEHSYVKEQSKGCSFAISMGQSAPVERLSGRSLSFTRPYRQDTQ